MISNYLRRFDKAVENESRLDWMVQGMCFMAEMLLVAMYNVNETMTTKQFKDFYKRLQKELNENVNEYLNAIIKNKKNAGALADMLIAHDLELRRKLGLDEKANAVKLKIKTVSEFKEKEKELEKDGYTGIGTW